MSDYRGWRNFQTWIVYTHLQSDTELYHTVNTYIERKHPTETELAEWLHKVLTNIQWAIHDDLFKDLFNDLIRETLNSVDLEAISANWLDTIPVE